MLSTPRLLVVALLLATVVSTPIAAGSPEATATKSVTFTDERGEQLGAPDITTVVVSNDDTGRISFRVNTPNRQRMTQDMRVRVTFRVRGRLFFLLADPYKPEPVRVALYRIEQGPSGVPIGLPLGAASLTFLYTRGARFTFDVSELGIDPAMNAEVPIAFDVLIHEGLRFTPGVGFDFSDARFDRAPSRNPRTFRYVAEFGL